MSAFPEYRGRRSRKKSALREMLRETRLVPQQLICPIFVADGRGVHEELAALPGIYRSSVDRLGAIAHELREFDVGAVLLFGLPRERDELARAALRADSLVCRALKELRRAEEGLVRISDLGVSAYTTQGYDGVLRGASVDNDSTLELLGEMALAHARAGADFVSPSASIDGQVGFVRETLDEEDLDEVGIISCSVRYRSVYARVGDPTRSSGDPLHAGDGARVGDDGAAQYVDPGNALEALREVEQDVDEGADMLGVEPALPCLDIIRRVCDETTLPVVGFSGAGEYQLIESAAQHGLIDGERAMLENLVAIRRAGAAAIVTFHALAAARALAGGAGEAVEAAREDSRAQSVGKARPAMRRARRGGRQTGRTP